MSKIERLCSTCKHYPSDEYCESCILNFMKSNDTNWSLKVLEPEESFINKPCEDAETIKVSKGTLKLRTGRFVVYDVEWLKEHFNTTEAMLYGKHFDKDINVPTTDAVSKEQAIDAIERLKVIISNNLPEMVYRSSVLKILEELPSVQPEQKVGKWIDEGQYADGHSAHAFRCSNCGGHIIDYICQVYDENPYCKWCGAKMEEGE